MKKFLISASAIVIANAISYFLFAGVTWAVMTLLGFNFTWRFSTALWLVAFILQLFIRGCQKR